MKTYYVGIDGGGSNTIAVIGDENGILKEIVGGGTNYHNLGLQAVHSEFSKIINRLCESISIEFEAITSICLGGAGVDTEEDERLLRGIFRELGYNGKLKVVNDGVIALAAANGSLEGVLLISGTGSIAIGATNGNIYRSGGWGHIIGDEGSGYAIGRDALISAAKAADGRVEPNALFEALKVAIEAETPDDIIQFVYKPNRGKDEIAALTPLVINAASTDVAAMNILNKNVEGLVEMVSALVSKLGKDNFTVAVSGSVLMKSDLYFELFIKALNQSYPGIKVKRTSEHPVKGAFQMAIQNQKEE